MRCGLRIIILGTALLASTGGVALAGTEGTARPAPSASVHSVGGKGIARPRPVKALPHAPSASRTSARQGFSPTIGRSASVAPPARRTSGLGAKNALTRHTTYNAALGGRATYDAKVLVRR